MLGWELPPLYAGGIGMVCWEMIKEFSNQGIPVTYIMPMGPEEGISNDFAKEVIIAENHKIGKAIKIGKNANIIKVPAGFHAYQSPEEYEKSYDNLIENATNSKNKISKNKISRSTLYGPNLFAEVDLFAKRLYNMTDDFDFDVIHAHDWMTFPAAIGIADKTGKPLIVHVHNTIYDRYLGNASNIEKDIERNGMIRADRIIAISGYVKDMIVNKYDIDPAKIRIVHNAKNTLMEAVPDAGPINIKDKKVVLFTGRITVQKGPEYFLYAAKKVLEKRKDVVFVMAGSGDMMSQMIRLTAELDISQNVLFTGRYNPSQGKSLYKRADCYVMPSVSEPFGIVPLEAMAQGAPCIISKQSGCSEVLGHVLKVDFWDTTEMAAKILSVLQYSVLNKQLKKYGLTEVNNLTWDKSIHKLLNVFGEVS